MRNVRILALPRYVAMGASSRVRSYQFEPYLKTAGFSISWHPLLNSEYLEQLYGRWSRSSWNVLECYSRRLKAVVRDQAADLIWLEKENWPWVPASVDTMFFPRKVPLVVDYDDATFHVYDKHRSPLVRALFGNKIDTVMRRATIVVAGNEYLAQRARAAGAARVEILPSVVDANVFIPRKRGDEQSDRSFNVGWIGSPASQRLLEPVMSILEATLHEPGDRLITIGANFGGRRFQHHTPLEWSIDSEAEEVQRFDVGIMPVDDAPFERGKCGYKVIQYMACGLPVIASPVGVNKEIIAHGETGLLASTPEEWGRAIQTLKADRALRRQMGSAGRARFESRYSLQIAAPRLVDIFRSAIGANGLGA